MKGKHISNWKCVAFEGLPYTPLPFLGNTSTAPSLTGLIIVCVSEQTVNFIRFSTNVNLDSITTLDTVYKKLVTNLISHQLLVNTVSQTSEGSFITWHSHPGLVQTLIRI